MKLCDTCSKPMQWNDGLLWTQHTQREVTEQKRIHLQSPNVGCNLQDGAQKLRRGHVHQLDRWRTEYRQGTSCIESEVNKYIPQHRAAANLM